MSTSNDPSAKERKKRYLHDRYLKNRDANRAYQRQYYLRNKTAILARMLHYSREHCGEYYLRNKNAIRTKSHMRRNTDENRLIRRNRNISKYGLTAMDYEVMLKKQEALCAICGQSETRIHARTGRPVALAIDHNHQTNTIRELLCARCNRVLGVVNENITLLQKAIAYLQKHEASRERR